MQDESVTNRLIGQAILAPSSHNTQPWLFERFENRLRLRADRTRALPVNDPDDRELVISCGCALFNLRVQAAREGFGAEVVVSPDPNDEDALADVIFTNPLGNKNLSELAEAISNRRTYRKRFADRQISSDIIEDLKSAAECEGAVLLPLSDEKTREAMAALVAAGDRVQWSNPHWRRELAQWMHQRRKGDGLSLPWLTVPVAQIVVRSFDMGGGIGAKDSELTKHSPLIAMLGTQKDEVPDRIAAGQALERVLLTAARSGIQASYLNQPIQVGELRSQLAELYGVHGAPQIQLRLGYPEEKLPATPRRPVGDVLDA